MTDQTITITLDGKEIEVREGMTILEAAREQGLDIPVICYHDATTPNGLCRVCVVDVNQAPLLQPACIVKCADGAVIDTRNERVETSRRTILEMLNSAVDLSEAPEIQQMMDDYQVDRQRFPDAQPREHPVIDDNPFYVRDYSQCVLCWRCVQVCAEDAQYTFALTLDNRGYQTEVATEFHVPMTDSPCVFCGQCIGVCPTGALKPKTEWGLEMGLSPDEIRQQTRRGRKRKNGRDSTG